jgi:preprotein translocase subunit SecG
MDKDLIIKIIEVLVFIVALVLIVLTIFQGKKDQSGLLVLSGGSSQLFTVQKEYGIEKLVSRVTLVLIVFVVVSSILIIILEK